ncbi:MAG: Flagellar hook-associated protein FlgK [Pedosphaera sp.]|nr:Flagellar hook-associated protein FlgK [Pedosphaera sp.]
MLGLFGTLNLGARSLAVQQEATAVAGQNLANVNNPAYARQLLQISSATPLQTFIGQEGTGVQSISITQVRDYLLDNQIQAEGSVTGSLNSQQFALQNAEAQIGEQLSNLTGGTTGTTTSSQGLTAGLSDLFSAMQALSTDPANLSKRQALVESAQALAGKFNQVSSGLNQVRTNLNSSIQSDTGLANQDLQGIADLNHQIMLAESGGGTANDLIDLRQQKIEDLAGKVNLTTTAQPNGSLDVAIGGVTMVAGGNLQDQLQTYDAGGGQLLIQAKNAGTQLTLSGGSIQGNIEVRDGALASVQSDVNTFASQLITQVNGVYSKGYDLNGGTGQNFFTGTDATTIGVNSSVANDPSKLQASGTSGASGDNTVILAMAQLANQSISGLNNQTFSQSYAGTVASLGSSLASVNDQITNTSAVSQMLGTQRNSVSGVSIDEEMTNMVQFQKAYQASAELITTVNQMLSTLIAMKTV